MAHILIVDDASFSRFMIKNILTAAGHQCTEAENGQEALAQIISAPPDLVITDLLMPVMDGITLLERLRDQQQQIPVMVLTANIQNPVRKQCEALGAAGFVNKPPDKAGLINLVGSVLKQQPGQSKPVS